VTPLERESPPMLQLEEDNLPLKIFKRNIKIKKEVLSDFVYSI